MGCGASKPTGAGVPAPAPGNHEAKAKTEQVAPVSLEAQAVQVQNATQLVSSTENIMTAAAEKGDAVREHIARLQKFKDALESKGVIETAEALTGNEDVVASLKVVSVLLPAMAENVDDTWNEAATAISQGLGKIFALVPPPFNLVAAPLGTILSSIVDQVTQVTANRKAAQNLGERVLEAARTIGELLSLILGQEGEAAQTITRHLEDLTKMLEEEALPFLKSFTDSGYGSKFLHASSQKKKLEDLDHRICEIVIKRIGPAVGRQNLAMTKKVYDIVEEIRGDVKEIKDILQDRFPPRSMTSQHKIWLEVAIDPPPALHTGGLSRLAGMIRRTDGIHKLLEAKHSLENLRSQQNLPIRFADSKNLPTSICEARVVLWLSLGSDFMKSSKADVERIKAALQATDRIHRPQLLIVCMKYGAQRVGEALAPLVPVIWMRGDLVSTPSGRAPASHQLQCVAVARAVVPTLHKLLAGKPRLSLADAADEIGKASAKCIEQAGAVGELLQDMDSQQELAENHPPFLRTFDADRFEDVTRCKVKELLSQDVDDVKKIRQELEDSDDPRIHLVSEGTGAHDRIRAVALHVLETLEGSEYTLIIRIDEVASLKEKQIESSTLLWLDLDEAPGEEDQKLLQQRLRKWDRDCENLAVLLTTQSDWNAGEAFQRIAICPGDGKGSTVSDLHDDFPIVYQSQSEGRISMLKHCTSNELTGMIQRAMELIKNAFLAGVFEGNEEGELVLRVCVSDVNFLNGLRDRILHGEFADMLTTAARELALNENRGLHRMSTRKLAGALEAATSSATTEAGQASSIAKELPAARRLPIPEDVTMAIDLTAFAKMYESSILRLEELTPHQQEKLYEGKLLIASGQSLHVMAAAGAGKTFLALHLMLERLRTAPNDATKARLLDRILQPCAGTHLISFAV